MALSFHENISVDSYVSAPTLLKFREGTDHRVTNGPNCPKLAHCIT